MANSIEPFYAQLGSEIQRQRTKRKMTQQQLGLSLQPPATRASVANIESGKQRVLAHTLVQLGALEAEVADLLAFRTSATSAADVRIAHELQVKVGLAERQVREITAHLKTGPE